MWNGGALCPNSSTAYIKRHEYSKFHSNIYSALTRGFDTELRQICIWARSDDLIRSNRVEVTLEILRYGDPSAPNVDGLSEYVAHANYCGSTLHDI